MKKGSKSQLSRREFLRTTAVAGAGMVAAPYLALGTPAIDRPMTRVLGSTGLEVTTFGLGGQASIQWTPSDVEPPDIIVKAFNQGVTYFDTSNVYKLSQTNYGNAFRALGLAPGRPNYDEKKRRSIVVASKTMVRHARGPIPGVESRSEGPPGSTAVTDLRRSLSQIFGDGTGDYPEGAYIDVFQIHNLKYPNQVDAIFEAYDDPDPGMERIGALAALLDYRNGTNRTGLNPKREKLINHIGITSHLSSPLLMDCIQRDHKGIIETVLTTANANDRRYLNHQYNVIPVAAARNMGIIGMKVFSDGAMYTKPAHWTQGPHEVVRTVGSPELPSAPLIQYSLGTPGMTTNIIGIGNIDNDKERCQLIQNMAASQMDGPMDESRRREIEELACRGKEGMSNYHQAPAEPLSPPQEPAVVQAKVGETRVARLTWHTAFAGDEPIARYDIQRDGRAIGRVTHRPQTTKKPFAFEDRLADRRAHNYRVVTIDAAGRTAQSEELLLTATG